MKKVWKFLGIAALAASLIPYKAEQDLETGERTVDALLWQLKTRPNHETGKRDIELSILSKRLPVKESHMFADEDIYACYPDVDRERIAELDIDEDCVESIF